MGTLHIGTMGWAYGFWRGSLYPSNTGLGEYLKEYAKHFQAVEIDSSFYRIPSRSVVSNWKTLVPEDFIFTAKFPRDVTHEKRLKDVSSKVEVFLRNLSILGKKLGPLLLQLPDNFEPNEYEVLMDFLSVLPKENRYAVEIRNEKMLGGRLYELLREEGMAIVIADNPRLPPVAVTTADFTYIRWEGDKTKIRGTTGRQEVDRRPDIEKWALKVKDLMGRIEVFGFFSKYYSGHSPTDAEYMLKMLIG